MIAHEQPPRDAAPVAAEREHDHVIAWRRTQLLRAGFPEDLADGLSHDGRYDLHRLIDLVERGCPPELAFRILAPLEGRDELATSEEGK
jgi:hypothetical protein